MHRLIAFFFAEAAALCFHIFPTSVITCIILCCANAACVIYLAWPIKLLKWTTVCSCFGFEYVALPSELFLSVFIRHQTRNFSVSSIGCAKWFPVWFAVFGWCHSRIGLYKFSPCWIFSLNKITQFKVWLSFYHLKQFRLNLDEEKNFGGTWCSVGCSLEDADLYGKYCILIFETAPYAARVFVVSNLAR